ncbi:MAG TPA: hypothetical protein VGI25_05375, partial [Candidatus Udaeobacter sp.]
MEQRVSQKYLQASVSTHSSASDFFVGRRWQLEKLSSMNIRLLILVLVLIKPLGSICADPAPITQE